MPATVYLDEMDAEAVKAFLAKRKGMTVPSKPCACGCGTLIPPLRTDGQPRMYIKGHKHRPPGEPGFSRQIYFSASQWEAVVKMSEAQGMTASAFVRQTVKERLEREKRKAGH